MDVKFICFLLDFHSFFRCESIGTTDARVFIEGIQENSSLTELDFSSNEISDSRGFAKGLAESLKVSEK